jgi:tetratricopeptide (TPR) repeat protein
MTNVAKVMLLLLAIGVSLIGCSPTMDSRVEVVHYAATLISQPDDQTALVNRCAHYINLARYAEAVADCTRDLELEPNGLHALQNCATAYQRWGRLRESLTDWEQALALLEHDEFWRRNGPDRIEYVRTQIQLIRQQLASAGESPKE